MHPMLLDIAREFVFQTVYYFSQRETEILRRFFTNTEKRVFFIHTLPANVGAGLIAMYSRIKNTRGLRGVFVDRFLPEFLASTSVVTEEKFGGDPTKALAHFNVVSIETFETNFPGGKELLDQFLNAISVDPDYLEEFAQGEKIKKFLSRWLDQYGHNSIARAGSMWVCYEQISILAAKSLEWGRPGSAYIELSTRYVDMSGKNCYPIEKELRILGVSEELVFNLLDESFKRYRNWQGENFSGPFPQFLRDTYGKYFTEAPKDLESGVIGETCDVLGNFLPAATLTSVGVAISGEAFPELIKHLLLDETPENYALVELTLQEAKKVGGQPGGHRVRTLHPRVLGACQRPRPGGDGDRDRVADAVEAERLAGRRQADDVGGVVAAVLGDDPAGRGESAEIVGEVVVEEIHQAKVRITPSPFAPVPATSTSMAIRSPVATSSLAPSMTAPVTAE